MAKNNNYSQSSVVNSTEESIYNSAKDWTEYLISKIKTARKLRSNCLYGSDSIEDIQKLSNNQIIKNRILALKLYIHEVEEVMEIGQEGIHETHNKKYKKLIKKISVIQRYLKSDFFDSSKNLQIDEGDFSVILEIIQKTFLESIHLINKSGLIYKFIRKRDPKKEAFKKEQKFLTV